MKIVRCTPEQETQFLLPESETMNIDNFFKLLPYFGYDTTTKRNITNAIFEPNADNKEANNFLKLNNNLRAWYEILQNEETDDVFKYYCESVCVLEHDPILQEEPTLHLQIFLYQNFIANKIEIKGQQQKLFKFLINKGWITNSSVDYINRNKINYTDKLYFCISRNPIDMLMCSTNQTFTSCENLESDYPFFLGLGALSADPNRSLLFISSGKIKKYNTHNIELKHFSYKQRSWGILSKKEPEDNNILMFIVRNYPNNKLNFSDILRSEEIGITSIDPDNNVNCNNINKLTSIYKFSTPRFYSGSEATIYLDSLGLSHGHEDGFNFDTSFYSTRGRTGCPIEFNLGCGFNDLNLNTIKDEEFKDLYSCDECGCTLHEDECYYAEDSGPYCEDCYNNIFTICSCCEDTIDIENGTRIINGDFICERCLSRHYSQCEECSKYNDKDSINITEDGTALCNRCYERYTYTCENCGIVYYNLENIIVHDNKCYCDSCYKSIKEE
jgi:hypothetical protein